jgi:hypothetical protein
MTRHLYPDYYPYQFQRPSNMVTSGVPHTKLARPVRPPDTYMRQNVIRWLEVNLGDT